SERRGAWALLFARRASIPLLRALRTPTSEPATMLPALISRLAHANLGLGDDEWTALLRRGDGSSVETGAAQGGVEAVRPQRGSGVEHPRSGRGGRVHQPGVVQVLRRKRCPGVAPVRAVLPSPGAGGDGRAGGGRHVSGALGAADRTGARAA